jgi:ABC-type lipoprotein release transport system permease subunit
MERVREFGVMMALGTRPRQVSLVIIYEGLLLGFVATAAGLALGMLATIPGMVWGIDFAALMGGTVDVAGVTMDAIVYPQWNWPGTLGACITAWLMTVLSTLWPAWHASRLEPVQAMRQA